MGGADGHARVAVRPHGRLSGADGHARVDGCLGGRLFYFFQQSARFAGRAQAEDREVAVLRHLKRSTTALIPAITPV